MSESTRLREQQQATDRANQAESLAYINSLLPDPEPDPELHHSTYRPDETDDQWTKNWEDDFELSTREWEDHG